MVRLAVCAVLVLAGCASNPEAPVPVVGAAPPTSAKSPAYGARFGIIESISLVHPPLSAAAGGTAAQAAQGPYRIALRMGDGSAHTVVVDSRAFLVGDRVWLLPDGRLIRA